MPETAMEPGALLEALDRNDLAGRKVALFGTSGNGTGEEVAALEELVVAKGAEVVGRFFCSGQVLFLINRGHPTGEDLGKARRFAREMAHDRTG